jgi:hypothetical protein
MIEQLVHLFVYRRGGLDDNNVRCDARIGTLALWVNDGSSLIILLKIRSVGARRRKLRPSRRVDVGLNGQSRRAEECNAAQDD